MIIDATENAQKMVVIEQPSFFSWYGYFGLIEVADIFVFYDDVQFERRSWQTRNRIINSNGSWSYIKVPIVKNQRETLLKNIHISYTESWKEKVINQLKNEYRKSFFLNYYIDDIYSILNRNYEYLVDLNIELIQYFCNILGIHMPQIIRSSQINGISGSKSERLISIIEHLGKKMYLSSTGAMGYIKPELFAEKNLSLYWYEFMPKEYEQKRENFVSHLSIVDILFRFGPTVTKKYICDIAYKSTWKYEV